MSWHSVGSKYSVHVACLLWRGVCCRELAICGGFTVFILDLFSAFFLASLLPQIVEKISEDSEVDIEVCNAFTVKERYVLFLKML